MEEVPHTAQRGGKNGINQQQQQHMSQGDNWPRTTPSKQMVMGEKNPFFLSNWMTNLSFTFTGLIIILL